MAAMAKNDEVAVNGTAGLADTMQFQIRMSRGLLIGFGGLVLLVALVVLALGMWSARQNTFDLLRDKSKATTALVLRRIEQYLKPTEGRPTHLERQMDNRSIDATNNDILGKHLSSTLTATSQAYSVVFLRKDAKMVFALRQEDRVDLQAVDISPMPVIVSALQVERSTTELHWSDVVRPEMVEAALLNVRCPVHRNG